MTRLAKAGIARNIGEGGGKSRWTLADTLEDGRVQIRKRLYDAVPALRPRGDVPLADMHVFELHFEMEKRGWTCFTKNRMIGQAKKGGKKVKRGLKQDLKDALDKELPVPIDYVHGSNLEWWIHYKDIPHSYARKTGVVVTLAQPEPKPVTTIGRVPAVT